MTDFRGFTFVKQAFKSVPLLLFLGSEFPRLPALSLLLGFVADMFLKRATLLLQYLVG